MPDMRMDMSKKNKYYIDAERKYELVHFCRQYKRWQEALKDVEGWAMPPVGQTKVNTGNVVVDVVERAATIRKFYKDRIDMIWKAACEADRDLCHYIVLGVIEDGMSYDRLYMVYHIPCCKDVYYDRRAKFFWILDKLRG